MINERIDRNTELIVHDVMRLRVKKHAAPRGGMGEEVIPDTDGSTDDDFELPPRSEKKGWFAKVEAKIKKTFYLQVDIQHRMYDAYNKAKESRRRQIQIMRDLNLDVSSGSEKDITQRTGGSHNAVS